MWSVKILIRLLGVSHMQVMRSPGRLALIGNTPFDPRTVHYYPRAQAGPYQGYSSFSYLSFGPSTPFGSSTPQFVRAV